MRMKLSAILPAILLAIAVPMFAHHGTGVSYDNSKAFTVKATVTEFRYANPHPQLFFDVKDDKGNVVNWRLDGYPPVVLSRTGWKRDATLKPGDRITVFGWQARDGTNWAHGRQVTFQDGKKLYFGPPSGTGDGGARPAVDTPQ